MNQSVLSRAVAATRRIFKQHVLRDPFEREMGRWRADKGDCMLRMRYPLTAASIVWDLGGYHGDFAAEMRQRYACSVCLFEPVPELFDRCVQRFAGDRAVTCLQYGLGNVDGRFDISDAADASSFVRNAGRSATIKAKVRPVPEVWREFGTSQVDLMKINIEGGEYDVLISLLDSGLVTNVGHLQIQFHNFFVDAPAQRDALRDRLRATHEEEWCYPFVWESWRRRA